MTNFQLQRKRVPHANGSHGSWFLANSVFVLATSAIFCCNILPFMLVYVCILSLYVCMYVRTYLAVMVFAFQVWGTVFSEDFQATWAVEWGSVARWVAAITVHFEISDAVVLFNLICIGFERDSCAQLKRYCIVVPLPTFGAFIFSCLRSAL